MNWSIVKLDTLYVTILMGELEYILHKSNVTIDPYDTETVLVTIELFKYVKFQVSPVDKYPICYAVNYRNCVSPTAATRDDLIIALNTILVEGVKVAKNGTLVGEQLEINFIEGANVTITAVNDNVNNKVDVTIGTSGSVVTDDPFPKILMLMGG